MEKLVVPIESLCGHCRKPMIKYYADQKNHPACQKEKNREMANERAKKMKKKKEGRTKVGVLGGIAAEINY